MDIRSLSPLINDRFFAGVALDEGQSSVKHLKKSPFYALSVKESGPSKTGLSNLRAGDGSGGDVKLRQKGLGVDSEQK